MARTTRHQQAPSRKTRTKAAISYAEHSNSESEAESNAVSTDGEGGDEEQEAPRPTRRVTRANQAQPLPADDAESDTVASDGEEENEDEEEAPRPTPRRITRASQPRLSPVVKRIHRPSESDSSAESDYKATSKRRKVATPSKSRASPSKPRAPPVKAKARLLKVATGTPTVVVRGSGVIPQWQTLPYQVLVRILQYASYPLYDEESFHPLPSLHWLLNVGLMCRAFAEPAATVLYASPPLVPMTKAHGLMRLLREDPENHKFKYRQKVETLRIDVGQVAAYSLSGRLKSALSRSSWRPN
jgi:hypothetical protein